jgi:predicted nucleic acid-binding Zn ribbon protein
MRRPAAIGDILSGVFAGTPAEMRLREGRIWLVWDQAVGAKIASHAQPATFRDGTLTLNVDSAPWMQQLNFLKREMIAKVNAELGQEMVRDLYFKAGRVVRQAPEPKPEKEKRRPLSDQELSWVSEQAASVEDPDLRAVFENLIKRDLQNR